MLSGTMKRDKGVRLVLFLIRAKPIKWIFIQLSGRGGGGGGGGVMGWTRETIPNCSFNTFYLFIYFLLLALITRLISKP